MNSAANLLWNIVLSSIGFAYFLYGRKQKRTTHFVCGLALMGFPYFVDNTIALAAIGFALCAAPYFIAF